MRIHRFYIKNKIEGNSLIIKDAELIHQWMKVFRLNIQDKVIIFDGTSFEYTASIESMSKNEVVLSIEEKKQAKIDNKIELHIFQSIIKKDNFEFIVEKCTEIGVSAFHPVISHRSEKKNLNLERLGKIAIEASEQSGRVNIPVIFEPSDLVSALKEFDGKLYVLDFDGKKFQTKDIVGKVGILVGPEGGWDEEEKSFFKELGIDSVSLGKQVLRAETASIAVSSLILLDK